MTPDDHSTRIYEATGRIRARVSMAAVSVNCLKEGADMVQQIHISEALEQLDRIREELPPLRESAVALRLSGTGDHDD